MRCSISLQERQIGCQGRAPGKAFMTHRHTIIKKAADQRVTPGPAAVHHGIGIKAVAIGKMLSLIHI